jgi:hypothetical protein
MLAPMQTKEQAEKVLLPYYPKLKQCLDGGWRAWTEHYKSRQHVLDARAQASIVYCEIVHIAKECFSAVPDAKLVKKGLTHLLYIGDDIVLRFKKLRNGLPRNIRTTQQKLFQHQEIIPGFLPGTIASVGYQLDAIEQAIEKSLIIAQLDGRTAWSLDLNICEAGGAIAVMPAAPKKPRSGPRVRARAAQPNKEQVQ